MGGNYQILHIQIVKKLLLSMAICSEPAGDPLTPPNWELARKMRVKLPLVSRDLEYCFGYLCKGATGQNY